VNGEQRGAAHAGKEKKKESQPKKNRPRTKRAAAKAQQIEGGDEDVQRHDCTRTQHRCSPHNERKTGWEG
jgi:hypothetical protein